MKKRLVENLKDLIEVEIESYSPEKLVNLLWKRNVEIKNITRKSITTIRFSINAKDYEILKTQGKRVGCKIKIIKRKGIKSKTLILKKRIVLFLGFFIFMGILYYLSGYIWNIDIKTEEYLTPYEVKKELKSYNIQPGIKKKYIDVGNLEKEIMKDNDEITWIKIRVEGSSLSVIVSERKNPPDVINEDEPCNMVAANDAEIVRVYTTSGTAVVSPGDIVKKGEILVRGIQGMEGKEYLTKSEGGVIGRTFYEETGKIDLIDFKKERTGESSFDLYINIAEKKIYLKNNGNKYSKYDKIVDNNKLYTKVTYYEVEETPYYIDKDSAVEKMSNELYDKIVLNFDDSIEVVDKKLYVEKIGDKYEVRLVLIAEKNIAIKAPIEIIKEN